MSFGGARYPAACAAAKPVAHFILFCCALEVKAGHDPTCNIAVRKVAIKVPDTLIPHIHMLPFCVFVEAIEVISHVLRSS